MRETIAIMLVMLTGCGGTPDVPDRSNPGITLVTPTYEPGEWPRSKDQAAEEAGNTAAAGGPIGPNAFDDGGRP